MVFDADFAFFGMSLKVFLIDLLLSGDNAVVIALACRSLPLRQARKAILFGTAAAILIRVYLATVVAYLLGVPGLKLAGALALLVIAVKLLVEEEGERRAHDEGTAKQSLDLIGAIMLIVIADLVMSLDNVVALAAAAQGSMLILAGGLLLSIPLLMYGSIFVAALLRRYPWLITAGGALLGWVAGGIAVSDPLIANWVNSQAPALAVAMPLLGAVFVLLESRVVEADRAQAAPASGEGEGESIGAPAASGDELTAALAGLVSRKLARRKSPAVASAPLPKYCPPGIEEALVAGALILLAEDNPLDQGAVKRALEALGCAVEVAGDGQAALDMLARRSYGLLITDCDMPNLDGLQLTARIRAEEAGSGRRLPIVGLLGYVAADTLMEKCREAGMDDCLYKPPAVDRLEAAVLGWLPVAAALRRQQPAPVLEG